MGAGRKAGEKMSRKEKKEQKQKLSTRQLINTKGITDYCLATYGHGDLVYFIIKPTKYPYCPKPASQPGSML